MSSLSKVFYRTVIIIAGERFPSKETYSTLGEADNALTQCYHHNPDADQFAITMYNGQGVLLLTYHYDPA